VVASISEIRVLNDPKTRFLGACVMTVHNIVPGNGGFTAVIEIPNPTPLNYAITALVAQQ